jgi:hypothetical protein
MNEENSGKTRRWEQRYRELDTDLARDGISAEVRNRMLRRVHELLDSTHAYGTATVAHSAGESMERVIGARTRGSRAVQPVHPVSTEG